MRKLAIVLLVLIFAQGLYAQQYARPDSDVAAGNWTTAPLFQKIDEVAPSDADYIITAVDADTCIVGLSDVTDPESAVSHILRVRAKRTSVPLAGKIKMYLMEGAVQRAYAQESLSTAFATKTYTLTVGEANSITDYTALRIKLTSNFTPAQEIWVSWAEFEVPNAPAPPYVPNKVIIITCLCIAFVGFRFVNKS